VKNVTVKEMIREMTNDFKKAKMKIGPNPTLIVVKVKDMTVDMMIDMIRLKSKSNCVLLNFKRVFLSSIF
jgi:sugar-specific transcriptional regulator TrmB